MYKNVLLTVDGSLLAEQAIPHAVDLANCSNAELHVVRVVLPIALLTPTPMDYEINENYRRNALNEAHVYMTNLENRLKSSLSTNLHVKVLEGIVIESLMEYIEQHHIDLIVMATHGRSGFSRWVFGSVADKILRMANIPVFLVRAHPEAASTKSKEKAAVV